MQASPIQRARFAPLLLASLAAGAAAHAQQEKAPTRASIRAAEAPAGSGRFCVYPSVRRAARAARAHADEAPLLLDEQEPNGSIADAQALPLTRATPAVDVSGFLVADETDFFAVTLEAGDWLNAAMVEPTEPDTKLAVFNAAGEKIMGNDDDNGQSDIYPAASPLLRTDGLNPNLAWIAPESGTFFLRVDGFNFVQTGAYELRLRLRRGGAERLDDEHRQIVFIDFDGATINPVELFGAGQELATLAPLSDFLPAWGLPADAATLNAVIDGVMAKVESNFEEIRGFVPDLEIEFRNSRDHADAFGQPNVTRVIVGGTSDQVGIGTIGLAQSIDPGNYERAETAIVLLDGLSNPLSGIAAQNIDRAPDVPLIDVVTAGVGNIAAHEVGHLIGLWHTEPANLTPSLIDAGGGFARRNIYDTGPDEIVGTQDDADTRFATDVYAFEGAAETGSTQHVGQRAAYALRPSLLCPPDLNHDDAVNGADLGRLLGAWGRSGASDLSDDGVTDAADLSLLLAAWGLCPN